MDSGVMGSDSFFDDEQPRQVQRPVVVPKPPPARDEEDFFPRGPTLSAAMFEGPRPPAARSPGGYEAFGEYDAVRQSSRRRHGGKKHKGHSGRSRKQGTKDRTSFSFD
jgi:hypothetical protein